MNSQDPEWSRFVFDVRRFVERTLVSEEVLRTAQFDQKLDEIVGGLVMRLQIRVLSKRLLSRSQVQAIEFPANPWQHMKARFAPGWFRHRWPVRTSTTSVVFEVDVDTVFPSARFPLDEKRLGPPVFHEIGRFNVESEDELAVAAWSQMTYQEIRNFVQETAMRDAEIRARMNRW